ncbi:saccharopine dehydrogenase NADP-binding domain-containing protein [Alteromonas ponticola]|uniref:Saccharopine dehydrogenase NADP-binding domain-containing protein n=1 Tax=Alteromonas aquimaris TaxID=2998417 RepID=A0ABT3P347_9ALTE|nr:saccharopine dehydrogenase NADP-binding domain-containing protein [Alteromonas aquimaris]MCW8107185.1 saccharopine dehydrogenase NADP-binding domain-containing protein [Alteromonas aquimaris]
MRDFDVVIFGATSFVGQIIARYFALHYSQQEKVKWALAGRSQDKLNALVKGLPSKHDNKPQLLVADVQDDLALANMCKRTKVVLSTVGPYSQYGEPVIKACIECDTSYVDLTGEPQWIKAMLDLYGKSANQSQAKLVNSCGFDSIPSDLGVYYLQQQSQLHFNKPCTKVAMRVKRIRGGASGGTIASILQLVEEMGRDKSLRKKIANPYVLCPPNHGFSKRQPNLKKACYDNHTQRWIAPFIMAAINTRIVHRSNALMGNPYTDHFVYEEALVTGKKTKGVMTGWMTTLGLGGFMAAASIKPLRSLMEKYWLPKSGEGPSEKAQQEGFFDIYFYGETDAGDTLIVQVTGDKDPGYGSTAQMISEAAIKLAKSDKLQALPGGFYTPASCFGDTLFTPLQEHAGLTFEEVGHSAVKAKITSP